MKSKPYLLYSDPHFHAWDAFSTDEGGVNSRLKLVLHELEMAYQTLVVEGGKHAFCGGDLFHVRGSVRPTVLNPVLDFYQNQEVSVRSFAISGNHDNEHRDTTIVGSMVTALSAAGVEVVSEPKLHIFEVDDGWVGCLPWYATVSELEQAIKDAKVYLDTNGFVASETDLLLHAPIDGVLIGVPNHGLTADWLAEQGFRRVFAGHYHNHVDFGNGVYSIGALTHQTWSDVGSKAGYLLVYPDRVEHYETDAPKFVDLTADNETEWATLAAGNYVRVTLQDPDGEAVRDANKLLKGMGAEGVLVRAITTKGSGVTRGTVTRLDSLAESINKFAKDKGGEELAILCDEILKEVT